MADKNGGPALTAAQILAALQSKFAPPKWAGVPEFSMPGPRASSRIDFWAIHCWASQDFRTGSFEIKVSHKDFERDVDNPDKRTFAEVMGSECWFVAPKGLLTPDEIPPPWGLYECNRGLTLTVAKPARRRETLEQLPMALVASMARSFAQVKQTELSRTRVAFKFEGRDLTAEDILAIAQQAFPDLITAKLEAAERRGRDEVVLTPWYQTAQCVMPLMQEAVLGSQYAKLPEDFPERVRVWLAERGVATRGLRDGLVQTVMDLQAMGQKLGVTEADYDRLKEQRDRRLPRTSW